MKFRHVDRRIAAAYKTIMRIATITLLLFIRMQAAAALELSLAGKDAEFLMEMLKGGRNTSSVNPSSGIATSMTLEVQRGGFDLLCKVSGIFFGRAICRIRLDLSVKDPVVRIEESDRQIEATFLDVGFVERLAQSLPHNPWRSETKAGDGSNLVSVSCESSNAEKSCRMSFAK